ncbi:TPA: hypothetical protein ENS27_02830 [bacterium]|nr:hypothetical protein [bacterium]
MFQPPRGEIWLINLDPTKGHKQSRIHPSLIISSLKVENCLRILLEL